MLPELARCLALLPNLQTVQIQDIWWWERCYETFEIGWLCKPIFEKAFDGHVFPSVRNAMLPSAAISLLKCFPNVRMVYINDAPRPEVNMTEFVQSVAQHCPLVEQFDWAAGAYAMAPVNDWTMSFYTTYRYHAVAFLDVVRHLPDLRRVQLYTMHHNIVSWSYIKDMDVITKIYTGNAPGNAGNEITRSNHVMDPPKPPMREIRYASK